MISIQARENSQYSHIKVLNKLILYLQCLQAIILVILLMGLHIILSRPMSLYIKFPMLLLYSIYEPLIEFYFTIF